MTRLHPFSDLRRLLVLGLPLVGGQLAQALIPIVDTAMLGRYDLEALAASVLSTMLWFTVFIVGSGFAYAVTPLVAAAEGDPVRMRRITRMGLWTSAGFGVLCLPVLLAGTPLLIAMGEPPVLAALAGDYLSIAAWSVLPALAVVVLKSFLAAQHRTGVVLWVTLAAVALNAVLNWVLIFGKFGLPEMGIRGAALSTLLMHTGTLAVVIWYLRRSFPDLGLFERLWRADWDELGQVFRLGWPIGVSALAEAALFSAATVMMGWIGVVALAAHGIALQIAVITFNMHVGLSQAATILAGNAFGRRDGPALRSIAMAALIASGLVAVASLCAMFTIPETLVRLFADPKDPLIDDILVAGVTLVMVAGVFQLADGVQVMMISLLRGVQDTRVPMGLTLISYWGVGAPLAFVGGIVLGFGGAGVWLGLVGGLTAAAALLSRRFWTRPVLGRNGGDAP